MVQKIGLLAACGVVLAFAALVWIRPLTGAGQAVLAGVVFAFVTGLGSMVWKARP